MKLLSVFWKLTVVVIVVVLTGILFLMTCVYHRTYYKDIFVKEKEYYSDNCVGLRYSNGAFSVKNLSEDRITIHKLNWAVRSWGTDSLGVFALGDKRGYFNCVTGKVVIPLQYEKAWIFSEGVACVKKGERLGFIDERGETIIPFQYPYWKEYARKTDFVFRNGTCAMFDSTGRCGIINRKGEWILSPRYDYINKPVAGFRIFKQEGQFGVLGNSLQEVLQARYDWIDILSDGFVVRDKENNLYMLAYDGETVLNPLVYYTVEPLSYVNSYDENGEEVQVLSEYLSYRISNLYGLMDKNGKPVTKAIYFAIRALPNDLFYCDLEEPKYSVLINNKGELVH